MIGKIWMWFKFSKFWSLLAGIYPLYYRSHGCCAENNLGKSFLASLQIFSACVSVFKLNFA
ncbi:hypothetical protein [Campylobacter concisus]|uniref:hypothetical protein n=1 Tax=Campylobacter concisus TaxID=199 RepID=UPI00112FC8B5|nr:hypothetical protein [Campylobacter concisus]